MNEATLVDDRKVVGTISSEATRPSSAGDHPGEHVHARAGSARRRGWRTGCADTARNAMPMRVRSISRYSTPIASAGHAEHREVVRR